MNIFPTYSSTPTPPQSAESPCVGVCRLDENGLCVGCDRNLDEIARWSQYDTTTRLHIMEEVLPQRRGSQ